MIVSLASCQDALVVVGEFHQVHAVSLAVVSVDFLAALQIIQANGEVFASRNQIFPVVRYVDRVYLLFLKADHS